LWICDNVSMYIFNLTGSRNTSLVSFYHGIKVVESYKGSDVLSLKATRVVICWVWKELLW
jgi:hypothetical protein